MTSLLSIYTPPLSLARQNNNSKTSRKIYPPKKLRIPNKPNPPPPTKLHNSPSIGTEATTYTRLPPKDDFFDQDDTQFVSILKLSEVTFPKIQEKKVLIGQLGKRVEPDNTEFEKKRGLVGELGDLGKRVESDYTEFEVFDADFDSDEEGDVGLDGKDLTFDDNDEVFDSGEDANGDFDDGGIVNFSDSEGVFEGGEEGEEVKEKGVPAVMRCFDRAKVFVKAGDGGNGVVAFRREKYVPFGGPSGGDGGRGGHIYVEVDNSMNSLLPFRNSLHFRAGRGSHGQGSKMAGAKGEDVVVKVAPGTVIREAVKDGIQGEVLLELLNHGQRALLLPGGRGGRGNASFKSGTNKVPRIAELGEEGPEMWLDLELKLVADIGIVGAPNAGKSTLLSVISAAQPSIANYPFTTLLPNLGVVTFGFDTTIVVADLPGLLEGAHRGFGLGHEFLRHTERCSALIHVVDGSAQQPEYEFDAIRLELELFNPEIAEKPFLVAFNKMDLPEAYERWPTFRENLQSRGIEPFCMSAINRDGTHEVITTAYQLLQKRIEETRIGAQAWKGSVNLNHVAETVRKQRSASINEFEITHDSSCNTWYVDGSGLQRFVQMTNWSYIDSEKRFQHILEACGVYKSLTKRGVKEGDTVVVGEMELVWHDSINTGPLNMRKKGADAIKWHSLKFQVGSQPMQVNGKEGSLLAQRSFFYSIVLQHTQRILHQPTYHARSDIWGLSYETK